MKKIVQKDNVLFLSYHENNGFYFPYAREKDIDPRMHLMSENGPFDNWLLKKYTTENISILKTDTVIDCGSFVGAFSIGAFKKNANKVYSIEPSSKNFNCINLNIDHYKANKLIQPCNFGLGDKNTSLKLNISSEGCEHSFLECDKGATGTFEEVDVYTLDYFIDFYNVDSDNLYLKIEAEGFELEIIKGLTSFKPRVITIDVTPERNGFSPRKDIEKILKNRYKLKHTSRCIFATNE